MSADAPPGAGEQAQSSTGGPAGPSEEELRAAYEAELSRITATDMMAQAAVSLLNIGARRLEPAGAGQAGGTGGQDPRRDLEQVRDAIDGVRALVGILERRIPQELAPLRDALSRLQMAYAREVKDGAGESPPAQAPAGSPGQAGPAGEGSEPEGGERPAAPGPAQASGRLWVPGR